MSTNTKELKPLALGLSPLGESAVIRSAGISSSHERITEFCRYHGLLMHETPLTNTIIVSTSSVGRDHSGRDFILAGRAFHRHTRDLLIGSQDAINNGIQASDIRGDAGEFYLIEIGDSSITVSADYFGVQSLFYYEHAETQIIASSYHLLLLILSRLGIDLEIDIEKSLDMLTEENVFGSGSAIEMQYCHLNAIDQSFHLTDSGLTVKTDAVKHSYLFDELDEFDRDVYSDLIFQARDEIVENISMIFNYPGFDEVIVDLSGGLDSRVIYAACTVLPQEIVRKKIRINTQFGPSPNAKKGGDLEFAALVNSIYNYPLWGGYSDTQSHYRDISNKRDGRLFDVNKISRLFGTHKNFNHVVPKYSDYYATNVTRLSGFIGEVYRGANFKASHGDKMRHINNYTNFRNRYMASRAFENILSPLASPKLLQASRMYQWTHEGGLSISPEVDVLTAINPLFSLLPFYNDDLKEFFSNVDTNDLLNYPQQISLSYEFVENPESTVVSMKRNPNAHDQFVLDYDYALLMLDRVAEYHPRLADFVEDFRGKGEDLVASRNARVLSMLWSLYFQIEIAYGRGDIG